MSIVTLSHWYLQVTNLVGRSGIRNASFLMAFGAMLGFCTYSSTKLETRLRIFSQSVGFTWTWEGKKTTGAPPWDPFFIQGVGPLDHGHEITIETNWWLRGFPISRNHHMNVLYQENAIPLSKLLRGCMGCKEKSETFTSYKLSHARHARLQGWQFIGLIWLTSEPHVCFLYIMQVGRNIYQQRHFLQVLGSVPSIDPHSGYLFVIIPWDHSYGSYGK